jgi:hypothetical protein
VTLKVRSRAGTALQSGHGIGNGDRKNTAAASPPSDDAIQTKAAQAYLEVGGSLELVEWRGALVRQAGQLAAKGFAEHVILGAAAALGRERAFPGYLSQYATEFAEKGGPCSWEGLDRSRLTAAQLGECSCRLCGEWREHALVAAATEAEARRPA